jgi:hypothetical protein
MEKVDARLGGIFNAELNLRLRSSLLNPLLCNPRPRKCFFLKNSEIREDAYPHSAASEVSLARRLSPE